MQRSIRLAILKMNPMSMSLDDVIAAKAAGAKRQNNSSRKPNTGGNNNHVGAVRGNKKQNLRSAPYEDRPRRDHGDFNNNHSAHVVHVVQQQQQPQVAKSNMSVFARLGSAPASGTRVSFSNLKASVDADDLRELCNAVGEIKDVDVSVARGGKISAVVLFARRSDATNCVSKFNGEDIFSFNALTFLSFNALINMTIIILLV